MSLYRGAIDRLYDLKNEEKTSFASCEDGSKSRTEIGFDVSVVYTSLLGRKSLWPSFTVSIKGGKYVL